MSEFTTIEIDERESDSEEDDDLSGTPNPWRDGGDDDPDPPGLCVETAIETAEVPDFPTAEEEHLVVA